jgi:hypothetical protein
VRGDLPGRQTPGREGEHDLVDAVQAAFALGQDHRLERPVPIPRDLDLHGPDLGQHGLGPGAVAHVLRDRHLTMLMAQVLRQLGFQCRLEDVLRQLVQQPTGADQAHALLLGLGQQPFGQLFLIDDLSRHRVDHLFRCLGRGL